MPCRPSVQAGGGQGVRSDPESEESEEKYRAVIKGATPTMNRSAKDGARSSPHYGGEGVTHSPIVPRCLLTARYGSFMRDPRRPACVPASNRESNGEVIETINPIIRGWGNYYCRSHVRKR